MVSINHESAWLSSIIDPTYIFQIKTCFWVYNCKLSVIVLLKYQFIFYTIIVFIQITKILQNPRISFNTLTFYSINNINFFLNLIFVILFSYLSKLINIGLKNEFLAFAVTLDENVNSVHFFIKLNVSLIWVLKLVLYLKWIIIFNAFHLILYHDLPYRVDFVHFLVLFIEHLDIDKVFS